jgi:cytosine/adenosine deaminase-related metal-dependent hydrolase
VFDSHDKHAAGDGERRCCGQAARRRAGPLLSARETLRAGTVGGSRALGYDDTLGSVQVGARADLVAYRTDTVTFTPLTDPVRQLVNAERGAGIGFVMVDGEPHSK